MAGKSREHQTNFVRPIALGALPGTKGKDGGARRDRTADLLNAIQALSQLSYDPINDPGVGKNCRRLKRPGRKAARNGRV